MYIIELKRRGRDGAPYAATRRWGPQVMSTMMSTSDKMGRAISNHSARCRMHAQRPPNVPRQIFVSLLAVAIGVMQAQ